MGKRGEGAAGVAQEERERERRECGPRRAGLGRVGPMRREREHTGRDTGLRERGWFEPVGLSHFPNSFLNFQKIN